MRGRELIRCGRIREGLTDLEQLAAEFPKDQELGETCGSQVFLSTGDLERAQALILGNILRCAYRPVLARVTAVKMAVIAGAAVPADVERLDEDFRSNCGQLERARILMGMGAWAEAALAAERIPTGSDTSYAFGDACCRAVLGAVAGRPLDGLVQAARTEAEEFVELRPMVALAQAIEADRSGRPDGKARAETLLAPLRETAAWDLDARLYLTIFDRATRTGR